MTLILLFVAMSTLFQADASTLIDELRSDRAETRREARRKLKELGKAAAPQLERAAKDPDAEVAETAKALLYVISISEKLTPRLKKLLPGLDERLATGTDRTWTEAFLEAAGERDGKPVHPEIQREDLEALAAAAVRGAETLTRKSDVMALVCAHRLRSAAPAMARLLQDKEEHVSEVTAFFLGYLGSPEPVPDLVRSLSGPDEAAVKCSIRALGQLRSKEAAPALAKLLEGALRKDALKALVKGGLRGFAPEIVPLLSDPSVDVRIAAASWLCDFGMDDGVPLILKEGDTEGLDWADALPLTFLNALRQPEAWRKLAGKSLEWKLTGQWGLQAKRAKTLERIAAEAGLRLDALPAAGWVQRELHVQMWSGPTTLPEDLMLILNGCEHDVILEADLIRIVPHADALKFWREWWGARPQKK